MKKLTLALAALLLAPALLSQSQAPAQKEVAKLTVADFSFMTGRWRGQLPGGNIAEQICSTVEMNEMICSFRLRTPKLWVLLEAYTLRQGDHGVELIGLATNDVLSMDAKDAQRLVLTPVELTSEKVVWGGEPGGPVKTSTLVFQGKDAMHGHIEHSGGTVDVDWKRIPYEAKLD